MAVFDRDQQKIVVRVVYDGPANAGKTTNLAQLCRFFTTMRRGELVAFEERAGRTLFFDWLHLDGGLVGGYPLRCQLVTVPGQAVLARRRQHLLKKADAVVFVCESTASGLDIGRRMLETLLRPDADGAQRAPCVPLVFQANKQDIPGCLEAPALAEALGLPPSVAVVGARAHEGIGVRETVVLAVRAAANRVQRELLALGLGALVGEAETSDALRSALEAEEAGQTSSAASAVLSTLGDDFAAQEPPRPPPPPCEAPDPPLPDPNVSFGLVWPAALGREIIREVARHEAVRRDDLVGRHGTSDGSGTSDAIIFRAAGWCLKTSRRRRYTDAEEARNAMVLLARRKTSLGPLLPPRTVLCLTPDTESGHWLWTVSPWLTTLRAWMTQADAACDEVGLGVALAAFADASIESVALAAQAGIVLDIHPSNFGVVEGRVVYLDDDIVSGVRIPAIGHALLRRLDEYARWPQAIEGYVRTLEASLTQRFDTGTALRMSVREAIAGAIVLSDAARAARDRLLRALDGPASPPGS
jgi:hypothetical protein